MPARSRILFLSDSCLTPQENIPVSGILCDGDKIIATGGATAFIREPGLQVVELENAFAMPGFIDSHIHGAGGFDLSRASENTNEAMNRMSVEMVKHGVTTFFPTLQPVPKKRLLENVAAVAAMIEQEHLGADPAGIHLEGPFINPHKALSYDPADVFPVDLGFAAEMIAAGAGRIKLMTFAPELKDADKLIQLLLENGVIPSMGHSMAGSEATLAAIEAGARRCTHIFNAMPPLHHRNDDLPLIALTDDRVSVEVIVDGGHIHPRMVDLLSRVKPSDKIIGVSNAVDPASDRALVSDPSGVLRKNGVIAGSGTTLETGWLHLTQYSHLELCKAAACFTANPAADLGLITRGEIKPGKKADITFFDAETNRVKMTVVRGKIVYRAEQ